MSVAYLLKACEVCERGAAVGALRNLVFKDGKLFAFNGIYQYQAPSPLAASEDFSVSEDRVASALRACGEEAELSVTADFLRIKNGPFTVRIKKIETVTALEPIMLAANPKKKPPKGLLEAIRKVRPFMSSDASRPWSVAVQIDSGYAWATNNLALVRSPLPFKSTRIRIPGPALDFISDLPSIDRMDVDDKGQIIIQSGDALVRFPQAQAEWPDMSKFFDAMPATLPELPKEMMDAASKVAKFAGRFVSINEARMESKTDSIESEYEINFANSKGMYSASLLSLILENATHADFSFYPAPIFFRGDGIEGTAVGVKEPT